MVSSLARSSRKSTGTGRLCNATTTSRAPARAMRDDVADQAPAAPAASM